MNTLLLISLLFNIHFAASNKDEFRQGAQLDETIDWPDDFMVCVSGDTIGLGALIHPDNLVYPFNKPKVTGPCENNYWFSPLIDWTNCINQFSHSKLGKDDKNTKTIFTRGEA